MRISNFIEFILESESIKMPFVMSDKLVSVIKSINSPISHDLIKMNLDSIQSEYTLLDTDLDGTNMISFVSSSLLKRSYSNISDDDIKLKMEMDPIKPGSQEWSKGRNKVKIGAMIRSIFSKKYSDINIEEYVNLFKHANKSEKAKFKIVKGSDIGHGYQVQNYSIKYGRNNSLWLSCMNNYDFFDIYIDNPKVCNQLQLIEEHIDKDTGEVKDKLLGRALLWETKEGKFMDKVYYVRDQDYFQFINWAKSNGYIYKDHNRTGEQYMKDNKSIYMKLDVILKHPIGLGGSIKDYKHFPYLDTLCYATNVNGGIQLSSYMPKSKGLIYKLTSDEGKFFVIANFNDEN